jgi:hypothetical protein
MTSGFGHSRVINKVTSVNIINSRIHQGLVFTASFLNPAVPIDAFRTYRLL